MSRRDDLRAKIAALRAKTTAAGCTEAEALAAAALAADLMARHGIGEAELKMTTATEPERSAGGWQGKLVAVICYCTNTVAIVADGTLHIVGREPGPEIAAYLRDVTVRAVEAEVRAFKATTPYRRKRKASTRRDLAVEFRAGMIHRLRQRLYLLFRPTVDAGQRLLAERARDAIFGPSFALTTRRHEVALGDAFHAGLRAGSDVPLHHGVGGGAEAKRIGGAS